MAEEPSYMMFARSNVRGGAMTSPLIVEALLARIDKLEKALADVSELADKAEPHALPGGYPSRPVEAFNIRKAINATKEG